jgi:hypothetical protein
MFALLVSMSGGTQPGSTVIVPSSSAGGAAVSDQS